MSIKSGEHDSLGGTGESDASDEESWLRKVVGGPPIAPRVALPQPGQVIAGKYRIEEQLGRGGMGAVFRATHVVSDKPVALKWMLRSISDERARQRFTREARAAGRIDHPNVVDVYDIGQEGEAGYLVMELLRGESLRSRLARGALSPTEVVDLLLPAMRGVAAAHREGVIHRDLKPDNIFLCKGQDGAGREAKVLDFGISAISAPDHDSQTTLTNDGTVLGTLTYMSPEQLESARDADARTDVYSFGVILYEALTGCVPFLGASYSALVLAIANTKPRLPRELRPEISLELERVVLQAMDKDRSKRVQSVDALVAALLPFASGQGVGQGDRASREPQLSAVGLARDRGGRGRYVIAAILLLGPFAWWLMHAFGGTAPAIRGGASFEPARTAAVSATHAMPARIVAHAVPASAAASLPALATRSPAAPPPESARGPSAGQEVGGDSAREVPAPQPGVVVPAVQNGVRRLKKPAEAPTDKNARPAPTTAAPPPPPAVTPPNQSRAGSISVDEL